VVLEVALPKQAGRAICGSVLCLRHMSVFCSVHTEPCWRLLHSSKRGLARFVQSFPSVKEAAYCVVAALRAFAWDSEP
jgi:hypothetical protein